MKTSKLRFNKEIHSINTHTHTHTRVRARRGEFLSQWRLAYFDHRSYFIHQSVDLHHAFNYNRVDYRTARVCIPVERGRPRCRPRRCILHREDPERALKRTTARQPRPTPCPTVRRTLFSASENYIFSTPQFLPLSSSVFFTLHVVNTTRLSLSLSLSR